MAEKKSSSSTTTTTTTTKKSSVSFNWLMNVLSYVAVCIGGIALFLAMILGKFGISASFCSALQKIANIIGWIVLCILSSKYIIHRRKIWMWVVWAIAIVMIIVGIILA